jgi:hypothetical protein
MAGKGTAVMGNNFYERPLAGSFMSPPGPIRLYEGETLNNNNAEAVFSWKMLFQCNLCCGWIIVALLALQNN